MTIEKQTTGDRSQTGYVNASIAAPKLSAHIDCISAIAQVLRVMAWLGPLYSLIVETISLLPRAWRYVTRK